MNKMRFDRSKNPVTGSLVTFFLLLTVLVLPGLSVTAQQPGDGRGDGPGRAGATPEMRAKRQTEMMKEELKLTAAQEPKVAEINLKYAKKVEEARKTSDMTARRKAILALQDQKNKEMKVILNANQYKDYLKMVEEMKKRAMNRPSS